jgi:hypothetical protein
VQVAVVHVGPAAALALVAGCYHDLSSEPPFTLERQATMTGSQATAITATLSSTPTAGDLLVMVGASVLSELDTVTGASVDWTRAVVAVGGDDVEIWYGVADGSDSAITISGCSAGPMWMSVSEWAGISTMDPLDTSSGSNGAGALASPGTTDAGALDLVIVAATCDGMLGIGSDQDWSQLQGTQVASDGLTIEQAEWWTAVRSGTEVSPTISVPSSLTWDAAIAAFRSTQE